MKCKHCNGTGFDQWQHDHTCKACKGNGEHSIFLPVVVVIVLVILLACVKMGLI